MPPKAKPASGRNVYLFIPNLIGYTRIILMLAAFYYAYKDWKLTVVLYLSSQKMDA